MKKLFASTLTILMALSCSTACDFGVGSSESSQASATGDSLFTTYQNLVTKDEFQTQYKQAFNNLQPDYTKDFVYTYSNYYTEVHDGGEDKNSTHERMEYDADSQIVLKHYEYQTNTSSNENYYRVYQEENGMIRYYYSKTNETEFRNLNFDSFWEFAHSQIPLELFPNPYKLFDDTTYYIDSNEDGATVYTLYSGDASDYSLRQIVFTDSEMLYRTKRYTKEADYEDTTIDVYRVYNESVTITLLPPTNHFLRNQAGCEWLNDLTVDEIDEIKIVNEYVGVAPGSLKNITSSTDRTAIAKLFEDLFWLDTAPIPEQNGQISGGNAVTVQLILADGTVQELYFNNGNYLDTNGNYFELLYLPKFEDSDTVTKTYGFVAYQGTGRALYDSSMSITDNAHYFCDIPIDALEFIIVDDFVPPEGGTLTTPISFNGFVVYVYEGLVIETEFGNLWFETDKVFHIAGHYTLGELTNYQLVGEDLFDLIEKYSNLADE